MTPALTTVTEYPLSTWNFTLDLDKHARVLSIRVRDGNSYMYVLEPYSGSKQPRSFIVHSTGSYSTIDMSKMRYIASFKQSEGMPVQHLFDTTSEEILTPVEQLAECSDDS